MRNSHGITLSSTDRPQELGSVGIPLLLLSVVLGSAAFGALSYSALWQSKAKLQLRLDRCVESAALELVKVQDTIESSNLRMKAERAAAAAAAAPSFGESIEAVQPILAAEVALQEFERARWMIRQAKWLALRGCDVRGDLLLPLPNLKWSRPPEDAIGPQPLEWEGKDARMEIRLWRGNRFSQARVERDSGKTGIIAHWKPEWIRSGPGLD